MSEMKKLTIVLTRRRPVVIDEAAWPVVASVKVKGSPTWEPSKPARRGDRTSTLEVRQHADGRAIVYGITSDGRQGGDITVMARLAEAIHYVGSHLGFDARMLDQCVAALPAEDLTQAAPLPVEKATPKPFKIFCIRCKNAAADLPDDFCLDCRGLEPLA